MIIGIDIDDTVALTNDVIVKDAIEYDKEHLEGKGVKNESSYDFSDLFHWSKSDVEKFMEFVRAGDSFGKIKPIPNAARYINKLYDEGNKIYFITRRKNTANMLKITTKWLLANDFKYNKLIMGVDNKGAVCRKERVDLFIDNDVDNLRNTIKHGVDSLLMGDAFNKDVDEFDRVDDWKEAYQYVHDILEVMMDE